MQGLGRAPKSVVQHKWQDQPLPDEPGEDEPYLRACAALCWLLTIPGGPMLYAGDEYGAYEASDPDDRHPFRGLAVASGAAKAGKLSGRESGLLAAVQKLGKAGATLAPLRYGGYESLGADETVMPFLRRLLSGEAAVVVAVHRGGKAESRTLDLSKLGRKSGAATEVLGLGGKLSVQGGKGALSPLPWGCAVFVVPK